MIVRIVFARPGWPSIGACAVGILGCKPSEDASRLKTLDNFTSSIKAVNVCFGAFEKTTLLPKIEVASSVIIDKKREGIYRDATLLALSAVPDSVKSIFAAQKGSVIRPA